MAVNKKGESETTNYPAARNIQQDNLMMLNFDPATPQIFRMK
jgi:hypothetical protein